MSERKPAWWNRIGERAQRRIEELVTTAERRGMPERIQLVLVVTGRGSLRLEVQPPREHYPEGA